MAGRLDAFLAMLDRGQDSAVLRYSLGTELLAAKDAAAAIAHLRRAVEQDPLYSAAWKALGQALAGQGSLADAADAYRRGIDAAGKRGDVQAAKEMKVFLRRIERKPAGEAGDVGA